MNLKEEFLQIKKSQELILALLRGIANNGTSSDKEKYYDLYELEKLLHVSRRTIFKWKSEEKLTFIQIYF